MPHVRKLIRDAIVARLNNLTTTGARVFPGRVYPLDDATELPGLLVYLEDEVVDGAASIGVKRLHEREPDLFVEACFKDLASLDDKGDTILSEVETALGPGAALGGAKYVMLTGVEFDRDGQGDKPAAKMRIRFKVLYYTAHGAPDAAL